MKTELAKRDRDIEIIQDIDAKNKVDLIKSLVAPVDGELPTTNEEVTSSDYTKTDHNEPQQHLVDPNVLRVMQEIVRNANAFVNEPDPNLPQITFEDNSTPLQPPPPIIKKPTLQEILTEPDEKKVITELVKVKDEVEPLVPPTAEETGLVFPERTGIRSVDERNYDDYLDTLQQIRPDLFVDEDDDYIEPNTMNALVPAGVQPTSNDPVDVVAQPDVQVIIPPVPSVIPNDQGTFAPPSPVSDVEIVDVIDPDIIPLPIKIDTEKIIITDDGDVKLTEPDNMQIDEKALVPLADGTVALPPTLEMEVVRTKDIILKRKNLNNLPEIGNVKMIKNEPANVTVRDVAPYSSSETAIVPYGSSNIKHPIQRRMEKSLSSARKQARIVRSKQIDLTTLNNVDNTPRINGEWDSIPTVYITTMNRLPWIDFNHILDSTDVNRREQVMRDLLQNKLPDDNDSYSIYHDVNTNTFSLQEEGPDAEEIDNLTTQILIINAKLKVRDLNDKERSTLIKTRKLKIKELRKTFNAAELASALSNNLSPQKLSRLEDTLVSHLTNLNRERDDNYYIFNNNTKEFEIRIDQDHTIITQIVSAILKLNDKIQNPSNSAYHKRRMYNIRNKFVAHLRKIGANELADNL